MYKRMRSKRHKKNHQKEKIGMIVLISFTTQSNKMKHNLQDLQEQKWVIPQHKKMMNVVVVLCLAK
jgi:C-terminal processing protease CtpA/Prc